MGGVPVKHRSKSAVGRNRANLALKKIRFSVCPDCKSPILPHHACINCGGYKSKARSTKS